MSPRIFPLIDRLTSRAAEATIGMSRIVNEPLREHLRSVLSRPAGTAGSLLADPVLEAAFGHRVIDATIADLVAEGLLREETALALAETEPLDPAERPARSTLGLDILPYTHQESAWRQLAAEPPRSVIVSAGTGSGKTEAFLVPILDALVRERSVHGRLSGVRALLLYPLNALIASQRDRLADWTAPFKGDIRFCLYNGETPEDLRQSERLRRPYEVRDRASLRGDPPPILVTNATMLEYMLVRAKDAPIVKASHGRLRWVVLDEAHSYLGSQAAEMTMLLRRTLHAFGVTPKDVSFIATSATLGDGEDIREQLADFLEQLSGTDRTRIDIIVGEKPDTTPPTTGFDGLAVDSAARSIRARLADGPATLNELRERVAPAVVPDLLERGILPSGPQGTAFLPLRLHLFHRAQAGVFACIDPACPGRAGTRLDDAAWPFGALFERDHTVCDHCGARTLDVLLCDDCGQPFLTASLDVGSSKIDRWRDAEAMDDFALGSDDDEGEEAEEPPPTPNQVLLTPVTLATPSAQSIGFLNVVPTTGEVRDAAGPNTLRFASFSTDFCPCCGGGSAHRHLFRAIRLGSRFFVGTAGNVLLDAALPHFATNQRRPHEGRQLITFTDNRQGTARFAASWQQEAERNFSRARIWHRLQEHKSVQDDAGITREIAQLEALPSALLTGMLAERLTELRRQLETMSTPQPVSWPDMRDRIAALLQEEPELLQFWREREPRFTEPRELANLYLYSEFLRRPLRANSLETLGLAALRFPAIERLNEAFIPALFREHYASLQDWKDYLHQLITFFVRANSAVHVDAGVARWTGQRVRSRAYLPWDVARDPQRWEYVWPRLSKQGGRASRPVLMLRDAFRLDLDDGSVREAVNDTLDVAWRALRGVALQGLADGALKLDLTSAEIVPVDRAWLCPVTTRLLDRCFLGITPYLTHAVQPLEHLRCDPVTMPRLPYPWLRTAEGRSAREEVEMWLQCDGTVAALRARGLWTDIVDRLAMLSPYVRIAEHSAQQPSTRLRAYEAAFKDGRINVLNCSTTMEMGVDIGGIDTVAMTNVPPSPANYRQRVGRAGRRSEPLAVAFTYCPDTPIGWHAFDRPDWPLRQRISPPRVALDSRVLVQRHMNAFLLSMFFRQQAMQAIGLGAGEFFAPLQGDAAPAIRFCRWLRADAAADQALKVAIARLAEATGLAGVSDVPERTAAAIERITQAWRDERGQLAADLEAAPTGPAQRSLHVQADRMDGEYLLGELARQAFLPGHGFPTDVVNFVTPPSPQIGHGQSQIGGREDGARVRQYPSRNLEIALREYAPGADVVLDGVVYRSAGVTLNWKRPATAEAAAEIQAIRWFWRCRACGAGGDTIRRPDACAACGYEAIDRQKALRPAGFSADPEAALTNAVEHVEFVPNPRPFVSASAGAWVAMENPEIGRFRRDPDGLVVTISRGAKGHGYAICLSCGRVEPEHVEASPVLAPHPRMSTHAPLRPRRTRSLRCDGPQQGFAVQRHLALGHSRQTEVFELQFTDAPGEDILLTVAVALREALCRRLGIERDEVAIDTGRTSGLDGRQCWSLWLFDTAAGGAGYAGSAATDVVGLLDDARYALDCLNDCERACPACLVLRDTARVASRLDRKAARMWLDELLTMLILPAEARVFGAAMTQGMARTPLSAEIARALAGDSEGALVFVLHGRSSDWDLDQWWAAPLLARLARGGIRVTLLLSPEGLGTITLDAVQALRILSERAGGQVEVAPWVTAPQPEGLLAVVATRTGVRGWAALRSGTGIPRAEPPAAVIWGHMLALPSVGTPLDLPARMKALLPSVHRVSIRHELDGAVSEFGSRFWRVLRQDAGISADLVQCGPPIRVEYEDRYLFSPISVRLLVSVLAEIRQSALRASGRSLPLVVRTLGDRGGSRAGIPSRLRDDWPNLQTRNGVLLKLVTTLGFAATVEVGERADLPHARMLRIEGARHRVEILLDQGFGFWRPTQRIPFYFNAREDEQALELSRANFSVVGERDRMTELFVELRHD
jgi:hypothetical protein